MKALVFILLISMVSNVTAKPFSAHTEYSRSGDMLAPTLLFNEGELIELTTRYTPRELSDQITRLDALCTAYLTLGQYDKFFSCIDVWESTSFVRTLGFKFDKDQAPERSSYAKAGQLLIAETRQTPTLYPVELQGRKHRLLAEAWFQLGDYQQSLQHATAALQAYAKVPALSAQTAYRNNLTFMAMYHGGHAPNSNASYSEPEYALPGGSDTFYWAYDQLFANTLAAQSEIRLGQSQRARPYLQALAVVNKSAAGDEINNSFHRARQYFVNTLLFELGDYQAMKPMTISNSEIGQQMLGYLAAGTGAVLMVGDVALALAGMNTDGALSKLAPSFFGVSEDLLANRLFAGLPFREKFQLALIASQHKNWSEMLKHLDDIVEDDDSEPFQEIRWLGWYQKGFALEQLGRLDDALKAYEQSIVLLENSRGNLSTESQKIGFVGDKSSAYQRAVAVLIKLGRNGEAFAYAERARSRALVDMLADSQARREAMPSSLTAQPLQLAQASNSDVKSRLVNTSTERGLQRARRASVENKQLQTQSLTTVTALSAQQLQALLSPGQLLIEYIELDQQWYAFKVSANAIDVVALNTPNLTERVSLYRKQLLRKQGQLFLANSQQLYQQLVAPLALADNTQVTVVASGVLHYLPFASLHDGKRYLLEKVTLSHLPSATVAAFLSADSVDSASQTSMLAMGNPTGDLPGAEREVKQLQQLLPNVSMVLTGQATETLLKRQGGQFKQLHIASHAEFNSQDIHQSRLVLAADGSNDGSLTMAEVYGLELNADLVVLSACETALGELANGDEVIGLTRGFLYAGSDNIVASLWKVDDMATQKLMNKFYQRLDQPAESYDLALRNAQLALLHNGYAHPFYWSAFQLTGRAGK
ncbi:CHAT domain-containing protein [Dasania marina]|uniref:CHAT domain-containing protein n=1 Tax=Dasania marina TaxID=471499 RepID=UPI0030D9BEF0|tara:strand:- start:73040 stop:75670 length:2631 start_codon:yes stop_codon:yes gene_type:complete